MVRWAELSGLCALALAEPIFEELRQAPEVFAVLEIRAPETLLFVLLATTVPPTLLWSAEQVVGLVSDRGRDLVHACFVAFLIASMAWQAAHGDSVEGDRFTTIVLASVFVVALLLYLCTSWLPSVARVLALAAPVVAVSFLLVPQVSRSFTSETVEPSGHSGGPPVVLLVFDELPLATLLGPDGDIDASLFPNFARLARESTWYRSARTVSDQTIHAVPAILTGRFPVRGRIGTSSDYSENVFSLFGRPVLEGEVVTDLCRPPRCRDRYSLSRKLTGLAETGSSAAVTLPFGLTDVDRGAFVEVIKEHGYGYPRGFDAFVRDLRALEPGSSHLAVFHELLPHSPWVYLPSGQTYPVPPGQVAGVWAGAASLIGIAFQRHVLQTQFVDRQLGRLMRAMKQASVYDEAVLAVTADHGISFRPGSSLRRLTPENAGWILPVPLFVKRPGQTRQAVRSVPMRTIDILPTLAQAAGVELTGRLEGRVPSAERDPGTDRRYLSHEAGLVRIPSSSVDRAFEGAVALRNKMLPGGTAFALGGAAHLIGRPAEALDTRPLPMVLDAEFDDVDPGAPHLNPVISGSLPGLSPDSRTRIAFAVNGRVAATGEVFDEYGQVRFRIVLPLRALRRGVNRIEVFRLNQPRSI